MKTQYLQRMLIGLGLAMFLVTPCSSATNYYVAASGSTPTDPWTNWAGAHTNLIEVIARARDNDIVYVTNNAKYYLTNQIYVAYAITVRSWGPGGILDPTNTIIDANYPNTTNRHVQLDNYGATLAGFTLTNGWAAGDTFDANVLAQGGSIWLRSGIVTNCIIMRNYALCTNATSWLQRGGGGIYVGDIYGIVNGSGGVWNCTISGNSTLMDGGGIVIRNGGPWRIENCTISGNSAGAMAGGIGTRTTVADYLMISNCRIVSNCSGWDAGGLMLSFTATCKDSIIMGNTSAVRGGGIQMTHGDASYINLLRNCLVVSNFSTTEGGGIFAHNSPLIQNCTIANNTAQNGGCCGGFSLDVFGGWGGTATIENTILWGNIGLLSTYSNWYVYADGASWAAFTNCGASPQIVSAFASEVNTITNDPRYVNAATGDFRLQSDSPCINAGVNRAWMEGAKDLYGYRRIDNFRKTVDIGAYEYLCQGTMFSGH